MVFGTVDASFPMTKMAKIIVVDRDKDICRIITDVLKEEGYRVTRAHDGEAALKKIRRQRYDLMILDYELSGTASGLTILEEALQIRPSLITIIISAFGKDFVKARAKELGAFDFLDKPFDIKRAVQVIKNTLAQNKLE